VTPAAREYLTKSRELLAFGAAFGQDPRHMNTKDAMLELLDAWLAALPAGTDGEAAGRELLGRWGEPHRRYHTVGHLVAVLSIVDGLEGSAETRLAAWFHDAVYDPERPDNEERSAELAGAVLGRLGVSADEVIRLVLLTRSHDPEPGDRNGAVLCDADLGILAAPAPEYAAYATAIRAEYRHVPDGAFRTGRAAVLAHLLGLPRLYRLHEHWEAPARANLGRELADLTTGVSGGADPLP
jgi:predicted metal-dependent HD superfamily phosphohydrolase